MGDSIGCIVIAKLYLYAYLNTIILVVYGVAKRRNKQQFSVAIRIESRRRIQVVYGVVLRRSIPQIIRSLRRIITIRTAEKSYDRETI